MGASEGMTAYESMAREAKSDENAKNVVNTTNYKKMGFMLENGHTPFNTSILISDEECARSPR